MIWLRLELAYWLDLWEQKVRRLGEKWGYPQAWFQEFQAYLGQPRMELWEFHVRYTLLRMDAEKKYMNRQLSADEAKEFYEEHDYFLWRNLVHRRHSAWRRVRTTMPHLGRLVEYGCGVAPVSSWVKRYRPCWVYDLWDLWGPASRYASWRVKTGVYQGAVKPMALRVDGVTALDVFEHLDNPIRIAHDLVDVLGSGGYMHWNIHYNESQNDLDLATREQLDATAKYLESVLEIVWRKGEYCVGRKR